MFTSSTSAMRLTRSITSCSSPGPSSSCCPSLCLAWACSSRKWSLPCRRRGCWARGQNVGGGGFYVQFYGISLRLQMSQVQEGLGLGVPSCSTCNRIVPFFGQILKFPESKGLCKWRVAWLWGRSSAVPGRAGRKAGARKETKHLCRVRAGDPRATGK
ncbi:unnamed protein product [Symbiodinium natans]|uniref:Uncharacterized protein n=1 Tax=Symbiodinium natans TaxID=878477 RepID=A0A812SJC7_9DINO|nr:unnamed protein product [Symbiodinium natans]